MQGLSEQEVIRREGLQELMDLNINPFPPQAFDVTCNSQELKSQFKADPEKFGTVSIAGRVMMKRIMGKASFVELQDAHGKIQLYINRDVICPAEDKSLYNTVFKKLTDIGDFIGVKGYGFITQTGEISIHVSEYFFLSKCLHPLPTVKVDADGKVHDAFVDPEGRYRRRYVDLIVNPHIKEIFIRRARLIQLMRDFFNARGWLEVETPALQSIHGGAAARPFKTHHNALDIPLYLRIANELYLKRLIIGGFDGVYEFGKMFRNEGMDRTHNPEFTSMEIYIAYKDYIWMMEMLEDLMDWMVPQVAGNKTVQIAGKAISFAKPYRRLSMFDAIREYAGFDVESKSEEELKAYCRSQHIKIDDTMGTGKLIDEIFSEKVEDQLIQPTYIIDYPIEMTPLAKKHRSKIGLVERFELYVNGKEIANAYTELNDPIDQRKRFEDQLVLAAKGDEEAMALDEEFLQAMEYGMPPTSGLGIGIDRLTMLLTGQESIQEVLFFPQMKPLPTEQ